MFQVSFAREIYRLEVVSRKQQTSKQANLFSQYLLNSLKAAYLVTTRCCLCKRRLAGNKTQTDESDFVIRVRRLLSYVS
jgi:hypothetical protein